MSYTRPGSTDRRVSWALQALDANRQGDVDKLRDAFSKARAGSNVNTVTLNGAYGGYRFPTWGKKSGYGGDLSGETMLHLCVREDNRCYPNRYLIAKVLVQELKIKTELVNEDENVARKLNQEAQCIVDSVHPLKDWSQLDVLAWLDGLGDWTKKNRQWYAHFNSQEVTGELLLTFLTEETNLTFTHWIQKTNHDLAHREVYALERKSIIAGLKQLYREFIMANQYRRKMEKPFIMEKRKIRRIEERKERKELAYMRDEEDWARAEEDYAFRAEMDALDEAHWIEEGPRLEAEVDRLGREEQALEDRIDAVEDGKTPEEQKEADETRAQLEDELEKLRIEKDHLAAQLDDLLDAKDEREKFKERQQLGITCREMRRDRILDEVSIETMEEKIHEYPNVCKTEEQRIEKMALIGERNLLKTTFEEKYFAESVETMFIEEMELAVFLCEKELPKLAERIVDLGNKMSELPDDDEGLEMFEKMDLEQQAVYSRKDRLNQYLYPFLLDRRDDLIKHRDVRIRAEADAKEKAAEAQQQKRFEEEEKARQERAAEEAKNRGGESGSDDEGEDDVEEDESLEEDGEERGEGDNEDGGNKGLRVAIEDSDDDSDRAFGSDDEEEKKK
jgi:hypothetical protein